MLGQARAPSPKARSPSSLADPRPFARRAPRRRTALTGAEELWRRRTPTTTRAFHNPLARGRARCLVSARPSSQSAPTPWLTYAEAAEYTGWSVAHLRNLVSAGQIPVYGKPRVRRFRRDMLDLFLTDPDAAMRRFRAERNPHGG